MMRWIFLTAIVAQAACGSAGVPAQGASAAGPVPQSEPVAESEPKTQTDRYATPRSDATPEPLMPAEFTDSLVTSAPLTRARWGIEVVDAETAEVLYRRNAREHFRPASNTKLVVTAVGLAKLGPEYRYHTPVFARGMEPGDSVAVALLVIGSGDPTLSERYHPTDLAALDSMADSLAVAGIRRISGDLIIDATRFDSIQVHSTWELGDLPWYYAAPVGAFAAGEAAYPIEVAPGPAVGEPARLEVLRPEAIRPVVVNHVVTVPYGEDDDLDVGFPLRRDTVVIAGTVSLDEAPDTEWLSVLDPGVYAGLALRKALEAEGIEVEGELRVLYDSVAAAAVRERFGLPGGVPWHSIGGVIPGMAGRQDTPGMAGRQDTAGTPGRQETAGTPDGREGADAPAPVFVWDSPPLSAVVAGILQPSQNWIAEQLLKTLAAELTGEGSWPAGLEIEERYLTEVVGIDSLAFYLRDASGLSAQDLLTPHAVVQLLAHARRAPWGDEYHAALARPGLEDSTLEDRLVALEGRLFAKTGTITHVNALSGYLVAENGKKLIFSILTDLSGIDSDLVREGMNEIVKAFASGRVVR